MAEVTADQLRTAKRMGISDERLAAVWGLTGAEGTAAVRALRKKLNVMPVYKMVDTCAGEFESYTPYLYSCYDEESEAPSSGRRSVVILGSSSLNQPTSKRWPQWKGS